jgi:hypothetical protein
MEPEVKARCKVGSAKPEDTARRQSAHFVIISTISANDPNPLSVALVIFDTISSRFLFASFCCSFFFSLADIGLSV